MSRKLMSVLVSIALVFGNVSTSAWSATVESDVVQTAAVQAEPVQVVKAAGNVSPLPPAGAAGIKEAQGSGISNLVGVALVVGTVLLIYLLLHDDRDDDDAPAATGT
jgi:hypothetical protein